MKLHYVPVFFLAFGGSAALFCGCSSEDNVPSKGSSSGSAPDASNGKPSPSAGEETTQEEEDGLPACGDLSPCTRSTTSDEKCAASAPFSTAFFCDSSSTLAPNCKPSGGESGKVLWCCPCK